MSEIIDLESNNLCTTEDAFEKFQAVSMYEEDEYITLSDILSPTGSGNNGSDTINVPSDQVSGQMKDPTPKVNLSATVQENEGQEETPENKTTIHTQRDVSKIKGRKKKYTKRSSLTKNIRKDSLETSVITHGNENTTTSSNINSDLNYDMIIGEQNSKMDSANQLEYQPNPSKISKKKSPCLSSFNVKKGTNKNKLSKRGRPTKLKTKRDNLTNKSDDTDDENKKDNRKRRKKLSDIPINSEPLINSETNLVPRSDSDNDKLELNECEEKALADINKVDKSEEVNSSNIIEINNDDLNEEDLPLVALSSKNSKNVHCAVNNLEISIDTKQKSLNDSNITYPVDSGHLSEKSPKKRGRPKKVNTNKISEDKLNLIEKECEEKVSSVVDESLHSLNSEPELSDLTSCQIQEHLVPKDSVITDLKENLPNEYLSKRSLKKPTMSDFEYNIDSIVKLDNKLEKSGLDDSESLMKESSRPVRRRAIKNFDYDEGSDEDPFANIESSDDDDLPRRKKGSKYFSDDEYIPGNKRQQNYLSDSDIDEEEEISKLKKKKVKKLDLGLPNKGPKKRGRKSNAEKIKSLVRSSIEKCETDGNVQANEESFERNIIEDKQQNSWDGKNEFQNFLAKIAKGTDIKIKKADALDIEKTALQIPILESTQVTKTVEMFTQTNVTVTKPVAVQTNSLYDIPMKNQVPLTAEQSEKACEFLSSIVKTTSELGQLMTQKSEDFIEKKINTKNVTDTFKMDYCVKKSFLLFKLAKHNLVQMEEDLSKHYEEFLKANDLLKHREEEKVIVPTSNTHSDSDCEIVEEPLVKPRKEKPAFNPKTVFLNKELSIKIAKKATEKPKPKEKLNIKGRHTVWINDSIMIKKVKPNQSFLAQDSRNKKPPDTYVTVQMVSDFFKEYERQKAVQMCAPYVKNQGFGNKTFLCYYFAETSSNIIENSHIPYNEPVDAPIAETEPTSRNENNPTSNSNKICPQSLCFICTQIIQRNMQSEYPTIANTNQKLQENITYVDACENKNENIQNQHVKLKVSSLKTLCYRTIKKLMYNLNFRDSEVKTLIPVCEKQQNNIYEKNNNVLFDIKIEGISKNSVKSLFSICLGLIQNCFRNENICEKPTSLYHPHSLKHIVFKRLKSIYYNKTMVNCLQENNSKGTLEVKTLEKICIETIVSIINGNTILDNSKCNEKKNSEAVKSLNYLCLNKVMTLLNQNSEYDNVQVDNGESLNFYIDKVNTVSEDVFLEDNYENYPENIHHSNQYTDDEEYDLCDSEDIINYECESREDDNNWVSQVQMQELRSCTDPIITQECEKSHETDIGLLNIKIEPYDVSESIVETSTIKIEPVEVEETNFTQLDVITKQENIISNSSNREVIQRQNSNSYDVDAFEAFVSSNKMILSMSNIDDEDVYTQSTSRVRRHYEPDSDDNNETYTDTLNLLVPQNVDTAKGRLMESSSDENVSKTTEKKKLEKRKLKPKRHKRELPTTKEKLVPKNDVAILTRRMRDKIRQEEKINQSSDSELEDMTLNLRKDKASNIDKNKKTKSPDNHSPEKEIQCNDVDSTEKIDDSYVEKEENENINVHIDTSNNEITLDGENESNQNFKTNIEPVNLNGQLSPLIKLDQPIELIECQPTMPLLENDNESNYEVDEETSSKVQLTSDGTVPFVDRHGWQCYPIDGKDSKIYQYPYVSLDKLPESFVETYFRYQDITEKNSDDAEVDKLTNLNSLRQRTVHIQPNDKNSGKVNNNKKNCSLPEKECISNENLQTDIKIETHNELSPSEDEREYDDNVSHFAPEQSSDNYMAKDSLMDDDSESEKIDDKDTKETKVDEEICNKPRTGRSSKSKDKDKLNPDDLMLTADKMMNKELALLHAPVVMKEEIEDKKDFPIRPTRSTNKNTTKISIIKEPKGEDDSSSEEEKQWFTTKEKLLKRLEKKQEVPNVDDAKRAKLVSEFIEKRGDGTETRQRARPRRRSNKKLLERRKQMKILSRELFGDENPHTGKKYQSQTNMSKGRRNIRKVIDKKSLGRNTVLANMEEFERKQRLSQRQAQLREVLGCEEGVNVVVINDELCLEYDFQELRPIVTVHPFFTKVMKAHQYSGVKFMWDACFESVAASRGGGGCILAHCMGLGKTLQVLALLHTVLTHPKVGMRRVLVCCPLSTVLNWVDEINKWIGPVTNTIKQRKIKRKLQVFELSKLKKTYERAYQLEDWFNGGGIFIIGYELFRSLTTLDPVLDNVRPTIVNKIRMALLDPGPDMIICDEGHLLKNDCSVLAVAMSRVVTKRRIILTGTPMQNNLREYYCMVNFVKPNLLGTYSEYSNRFENPIMNGQHRDSREEDIKLMKARTHILHKVLEGCLQRQEASVLYPYLPKKYEYTLFITLTKCQRELYNHYLSNCTKETKQSVLKDFHVLQKIWTHPQVLHNFLTRARDDGTDTKIKVEKLEDDLAREDLGASEDAKPGAAGGAWEPHVAPLQLRALDSSNKFLVVFRLLQECVELGDKVLIFSTSLYTMDALEFFLRRERAWALGREYYRLDGSVPAEVRQKWCREFNAPNNVTTRLFLISTRAGCLGLNMTAANRVIILDTSWNPAHDIQSIFRVYRFGQKKDCYIYRLVAMGTMEQKIYERSVTKQAVACRVVDEQQIDRHYNMSDLSELYKLDEEGAGVSAGLAAGVRDAALLRVARADAAGAALHAVHEHDSLLRGSGESGLPEDERAAAWMQFQQEHAANHTTIKNIEIDLAAKKTGDDLLGNNEIHIKTEADKSKNLPEGKPKREKKTSTKKTSYIDSQPSTSRQTESSLKPEAEESMIKKIMGILIKHNFHTTKTAQEISDLVVDVRNVIANAKKNGLDNVNPLTASIAKVLLESEALPIAESNNVSLKEENQSPESESTEMIIGIPCDEDIRSAVGIHDKDTSKEEYFDRKRRRERKQSDEEYVPETRRKKKKVIPSEKSKRKRTNDKNVSINDESSFDSSQTESQQSVLTETENSVATILQPVTNKTPEQILNEQLITGGTIETEVSKTNMPVEEVKDSDDCMVVESILLSDDDDEPLSVIKPTENVNMDHSKDNEVDKDESNEIIPLHQSLLTNKNFIKIVAHTYLSGNPMLDEDAAILAAQYSAIKALKEIKSTGKEITSGPIYDIAVKVLGKSLLKKLQTVRGMKDFSMSIEPENTNNQIDITTESFSEPKLKKVTVPEAKTKRANHKKHLITKQKNHSINSTQISGNEKNGVDQYGSQSNAVPISCGSHSVVPVGIFKGPASLHPNEPPLQDECILPDDDDVMITPLNTEATSANKNIYQKNATRRNSQKLLVNAVIADSNKTEKNAKHVLIQPKPVNLIVAPVSTGVTKPTIMSIAKVGHEVGTTNPGTSTQLSDTICLDSDEDDITSDISNVVPVQENQNVTPITKAENVSADLPINSPSTLKKKIVLFPALMETSKSTHSTADINKVNANCKKTKETVRSSLSSNKESRSQKVLNTTNCKPGDILRISQSGKIEVLKRTDLLPASVSSYANNEVRTQNRADSEFITDDCQIITPKVTKKSTAKTVSSTPKIVTEKKDPKNNKEVEKCNNSIHTNIKTPDPLSVLDDVIHIPSDENEKSVTNHYKNADKLTFNQEASVAKDNTKSTKDPKAVARQSTKINMKKVEEKLEVSNANNKIDLTATNTKVSNIAPSTSKPEIKNEISTIKSCINDEINTSKSHVSTARIIEAREPTNNIKKLEKKNKETKNDVIKRNNKIDLTTTTEDTMKVIDLTDNSSANDADKRIANNKKDSIAIAGTSKNIIINKMATLLNNSKNTPTKDVTKVLNNKTSARKIVNITLQKVATSDNLKRTSPWQESDIKKMKPESSKPMTLKDFNLDDFDDIIELE
ncbi:uncharacterized protein LOC124537542 [Vanessa cardui]|uniref:uncharacterized protein LOC124537542 n=1 Tax=Vanessa cardui TaxID=171605 RepID=UPI001F13BA4D|nr:uncharacterized protein LOC124537542 [Vanessa cardui]